MARLRYNGLQATLGGTGLTTTDTTITFGAALTHSGGTAVPTIGGGDYIPLTLLDSAGNVAEIVQLTAYTSGATTGTISRAQESTAAKAHSVGAVVINAATTTDFSSATLTVQDENGNVSTTVTQIDFQGAGVTATAGTGEVVVTIPGGGGSSTPSPDDASQWSPSLGYDLEFNSGWTAPPSGWSWKDQGATTYSESFGHGVWSNLPSGTFNTRGWMRPFPTEATWTMTAKMGAVSTATGSRGYGAGLFLHNSTSNKTIHLQVGYQAGKNVFLFNLSANGFVASIVEVSLLYTPNYFRIVKNSATSYDFQVSRDCILWETIQAAYNVSAQFTPDYIGLGATVWGSEVAKFDADWLRIR